MTSLQRYTIFTKTAENIYTAMRKNVFGENYLNIGEKGSNLSIISPKWNKIYPFWRKYFHSVLQRFCAMLMMCWQYTGP